MKQAGPLPADARAAYQQGRRDAFAAAADSLTLSAATLRLHAGELTAGELRAVQAVLKWKIAELRDKAAGY